MRGLARKTFRKVITSPENIEKIESSNKKLVERFLRYMSQTKSEGTIKVYKSMTTYISIILINISILIDKCYSSSNQS